MSTRLTIDDDLLKRARLLAVKTRQPVSAVVREALRIGFAHLEGSARQRPYVTTPRAMGLRPDHDLGNVQELIAQVEGASAR